MFDGFAPVDVVMLLDDAGLRIYSGPASDAFGAYQRFSFDDSGDDATALDDYFFDLYRSSHVPLTAASIQRRASSIDLASGV